VPATVAWFASAEEAADLDAARTVPCYSLADGMMQTQHLKFCALHVNFHSAWRHVHCNGLTAYLKSVLRFLHAGVLWMTSQEFALALPSHSAMHMEHADGQCI
jgi:hypothetical protein